MNIGLIFKINMVIKSGQKQNSLASFSTQINNFSDETGKQFWQNRSHIISLILVQFVSTNFPPWLRTNFSKPFFFWSQTWTIPKLFNNILLTIFFKKFKIENWVLNCYNCFMYFFSSHFSHMKYSDLVSLNVYDDSECMERLNLDFMKSIYSKV